MSPQDGLTLIYIVQNLLFWGLIIAAAIVHASVFAHMVRHGYYCDCDGDARSAVGQSPTQGEARNALAPVTESPRAIDRPSTSRVSANPPPCRPLFASDLIEAKTSSSAGQGDAT